MASVSRFLTNKLRLKVNEARLGEGALGYECFGDGVSRLDGQEVAGQGQASSCGRQTWHCPIIDWYHERLHSDAELGDRSTMDRRIRAGCLNLAHLQYGTASADIGHDRQPAKICDSLAQKFETFARSIGLLDRRATNVVGLDAPGSHKGRRPPGQSARRTRSGCALWLPLPRSLVRMLT
jgi:hypothetical protein